MYMYVHAHLSYLPIYHLQRKLQGRKEVELFDQPSLIINHPGIYQD